MRNGMSVLLVAANAGADINNARNTSAIATLLAQCAATEDADASGCFGCENVEF
jgi:hypothetical protein